MTEGRLGGKIRIVVLGVALLLGLATIGVFATGFGPGFGGGPPVVHRLSGSFEHTGTSGPVGSSTPAPPDTGSVAGSSTPEAAPSEAPPAVPTVNCDTRGGEHKKHDHHGSCKPAGDHQWWWAWSWGQGGEGDH